MNDGRPLGCTSYWLCTDRLVIQLHAVGCFTLFVGHINSTSSSSICKALFHDKVKPQKNKDAIEELPGCHLLACGSEGNADRCQIVAVAGLQQQQLLQHGWCPLHLRWQWWSLDHAGAHAFRPFRPPWVQTEPIQMRSPSSSGNGCSSFLMPALLVHSCGMKEYLKFSSCW